VNNTFPDENLGNLGVKISQQEFCSQTNCYGIEAIYQYNRETETNNFSDQKLDTQKYQNTTIKFNSSSAELSIKWCVLGETMIPLEGTMYSNLVDQ